MLDVVLGTGLHIHTQHQSQSDSMYVIAVRSEPAMVLSVDVQPGPAQRQACHGRSVVVADRWDRGRWPTLLRGDLAWGIEPVMAQAEHELGLFVPLADDEECQSGTATGDGPV